MACRRSVRVDFIFWNIAMALSEFRILIAVTAVVIVSCRLGLADDETKMPKNESAEEGTKKYPDGRLSAKENFITAPFVIPVVKDGE